MKKGITISILVVTVVLMFIIVTTATVIGTRTIQTASYEEFMSKIYRVSNDVNKYVIDNNSLPITSEIIAKEGLSNAFKEELNKNKDVWNNLFVIDMSKLRTESVNIGKGTIEDMDVFVVAENTNNVYYLKGVKYKGETYYGLQIEGAANNGSIEGGLNSSVETVVDSVPIPKGFVASQATGENTKNGGLVIYEGTEPVTDQNLEIALTTRNQYVWVPVESGKFNTKFIRQNFGRENVISNVVGTEYWEVELDDILNIPLTTQSNTKYFPSTTLKEIQELYDSVKKYKGFYIARYEAGIDVPRTELGSDATLLPRANSVYSQMNKIPYNYMLWTWNEAIDQDTNGAVEIARSIYPNDSTNLTGAVSTLVYGVQWDTALQWFQDTNAVENLIDSSSYGNHQNHTILSSSDLNNGAKVLDYTSGSSVYVERDSETLSYPKDNATTWLLSTGALKVAKLNNIYDMAGNEWEWTMEGVSTTNRAVRGGSFYLNADDNYSISNRYSLSPNAEDLDIGFRIALYIK